MKIKPLLIQVDTESEKNTNWIDGTICYVVATTTYYKLESGSFVATTDYNVTNIVIAGSTPSNPVENMIWIDIS